jgi:hypothetical protein
VKKEFRRARARAVFSIPRICDLLEPLSQPLFLSISLIQIRDDDDRKSRVMMSACVRSLSLSLFLLLKMKTLVSLFLLLFVRKPEVTNRQIVTSVFFSHLSSEVSFARTQHVSHKHVSHTHIVRLWFRKENRITIGILTIVV